MLDRDYRDIVAGLGLTLIGVAAALYALSKYSMGTVSRMGPGMMPVSLGVILAVFGLSIAIPALFRKGAPSDLRLRPLIVLCICIVCFALMIETLGFVPAVFSTVVIATFAENRVPLTRALILGAGLALLTWAIFILGLGLPISSFDWAF
ncbi:tripartite tricarboxylate transporter TctB family protein [Pseudogemmobacter sp. W21_MBD1_M6]|uniref:tripartite tricarboxylate transporter TctB family protein n=1 Tax=Pseudogemmobacter sp. W21_MBD1_M6 TaxID=3240271 RepID=UPI003F98DA5B